MCFYLLIYSIHIMFIIGYTVIDLLNLLYVISMLRLMKIVTHFYSYSTIVQIIPILIFITLFRFITMTSTLAILLAINYYSKM